MIDLPHGISGGRYLLGTVQLNCCFWNVKVSGDVRSLKVNSCGSKRRGFCEWFQTFRIYGVHVIAGP